MNGRDTWSSYTSENLRRQTYDNVNERNALFYNYTLQPKLQQNHHDSYFENKAPGSEGDVSTAPRDYYRNLPVANGAQLIGSGATTPNIYDDIVRPWIPTRYVPDLNRSGEPFTTTALNPRRFEYRKWTPHEKPCELAPVHSSRLWVADLNAAQYERTVLSNADEQPYANFNRTQNLINLLNINMPNKSDYYTKPIRGETYCGQTERNGQPGIISG